MLEGPKDGVWEGKTDVEFAWILTWHQMYHVSQSLGLFNNNHALKVGPTQNRETMALRTLTINGLLSYLIMLEDPT
jgi:hypothetical protein